MSHIANKYLQFFSTFDSIFGEEKNLLFKKNNIKKIISRSVNSDFLFLFLFLGDWKKDIFALFAKS